MVKSLKLVVIGILLTLMVGVNTGTIFAQNKKVNKSAAAKKKKTAEIFEKIV